MIKKYRLFVHISILFCFYIQSTHFSIFFLTTKPLWDRLSRGRMINSKSPSELPLLNLCFPVMTHLWHACKKWHATTFGVAHKHSSTSDNYSQKHISFFGNFQRLQSGYALVHPPEAVWEGHALMCRLEPPKIAQEWGKCFCMGFGGCRGHERAFSEIHSRMKALWNHLQHWAGYRSLPNRKKIPLEVACSRFWSVLDNVPLKIVLLFKKASLHHSPSCKATWGPTH